MSKFPTLCLAALVAVAGCAPDFNTADVRDRVDRKEGLIEVSPAALVFGIVTPGSQPVLSFHITNTGEQVFDVEGLDFVGAADAFELVTVPSLPLEIAPGATVTLQVRFTARRGDLDEAEIVVRSNASNADEVRVALNGKGGVQQIEVLPGSVDFGERALGCVGVQPVEVKNVGSAPLTISSITDDEGANISLVSVPAMPLVLEPGASRRVSAFFEPLEAGAFAEVLLVQSDDPDGPASVPLSGRSTPQEWVTDRFEVPERFEVDVILAVDRSGSMADQGDDVGLAVAGLIKRLEDIGGDWHLGILLGREDDCFELGWMDASTPNWEQEAELRASVVPETVALTRDQRAALTEALLEATSLATLQDAPGLCNVGFRRPGAMLQVILVSDERDQSSGFVDQPKIYWENWVQTLRDYAGLDELLRIHGVVDEAGACGDVDPSSLGAEGYVDAVMATGGKITDVCDTPEHAVPALHERFLVRPWHFPISADNPIVDTMTVSIDAAPLTEGWTFEPSLMAVVLDEEPPAGAEIVVEYSLIGQCSP